MAMLRCPIDITKVYLLLLERSERGRSTSQMAGELGCWHDGDEAWVLHRVRCIRLTMKKVAVPVGAAMISQDRGKQVAD